MNTRTLEHSLVMTSISLSRSQSLTIETSFGRADHYSTSSGNNLSSLCEAFSAIHSNRSTGDLTSKSLMEQGRRFKSTRHEAAKPREQASACRQNRLTATGNQQQPTIPRVT